MNDLSIQTPVLNVEPWIKAWCEFATKISDDVHVIDTGSTDKTLEILSEYPIHVEHHKIKSPYNWDEGKIRNRLLRSCRNKWILQLDADELFGDEFVNELPEILDSKKKFLWFRHYPFWHYPNFIRIVQLRGQAWRSEYPRMRHKIHLNHPKINYMDEGNHAHLQYRGLGRMSCRLSSEYFDIPYFHYGTAVPQGRLRGSGRYDQLYQNGIKTITFWGKHPDEVKYFDWWNDRTS
jgi:glycosyltransferase involved in cell wall biosynthesis